MNPPPQNQRNQPLQENIDPTIEPVGSYMGARETYKLDPVSVDPSSTRKMKT